MIISVRAARFALPGVVLLLAVTLAGCMPETYPFGNLSCWSPQAEEPTLVGVECFDEQPAESWEWDGKSETAVWTAYRCTEDTELCPGRLECERGVLTFDRLCALPGSAQITAGGPPVEVVRPLPPEDGDAFTFTPQEIDGVWVYPCGVFYSGYWGVKQIDLSTFYYCSEYTPDQVSVACFDSAGEWSADGVTLSAQGGLLNATIKRHGACGIFPPAAEDGTLEIDETISFEFEFGG